MTKEIGVAVITVPSNSGAWWYKHCHQSNLNGKYDGHCTFGKGITWYTLKGTDYYSLLFVAMKVRCVY